MYLFSADGATSASSWYGHSLTLPRSGTRLLSRRRRSPRRCFLFWRRFRTLLIFYGPWRSLLPGRRTLLDHFRVQLYFRSSRWGLGDQHFLTLLSANPSHSQKYPTVSHHTLERLHERPCKTHESLICKILNRLCPKSELWSICRQAISRSIRTPTQQ